jgi:hypothetical protein
VVRDKVRRGLKSLQVDEALTLPCLLELLSVQDCGFDQISMSPEGKKDRHTGKGEYEEALLGYQEMSDDASAARSASWIARVPNSIGGIYLDLFDLDEALLFAARITPNV